MTYGLLRVKNEARWIERVIRSIEPACVRVYVLDDHSDDGTPEICEALGCTVFRSEFEGIHEARDKDFLLEKVWEDGAQLGDTCLMIDGDEVLHPNDVELIREFELSNRTAASLRILYLWNDEQHWRADGVYRKFYRPSLFKLTTRNLTFKRTDFGGNFHCSSVPAAHIPHARPIGARLLHLGYMHAEDRVRKYNWYRSVDPNNTVEDGYRHVAQGDLPELPATARFRWGGPLHLLPL